MVNTVSQSVPTLRRPQQLKLNPAEPEMNKKNNNTAAFIICSAYGFKVRTKYNPESDFTQKFTHIAFVSFNPILQTCTWIRFQSARNLKFLLIPSPHFATIYIIIWKCLNINNTYQQGDTRSSPRGLDTVRHQLDSALRCKVNIFHIVA